MTANLQPGEMLLVHGGSSGIGTMAIQLASQVGARVAVTAGSAEKLERCRELGAEVLVNYRDDDFVERVRAATDGRGADVVLDNMGAKYLARNVDVLAPNGRLVVIGLQGGTKAELNLGALLSKRAAVIATSLRARPAGEKAAIVAAVREHVWPLVEARGGAARRPRSGAARARGRRAPAARGLWPRGQGAPHPLSDLSPLLARWHPVANLWRKGAPVATRSTAAGGPCCQPMATGCHRAKPGERWLTGRGYRVYMLLTGHILGIHTLGGRYVDQAGTPGAAGAAADVRGAAARGVRGAHGRHVAAQRRAGLLHAQPAGARRARRGRRGAGRGRAHRLPPHRAGPAGGRPVVAHPGRPHRAPARRAHDQAGARRHGARRRRPGGRAGPAHPDAALAARPHPVEAAGHRRRRPRLAARARQPRLRRRGRGALARPRRGAPAAPSGQPAPGVPPSTSRPTREPEARR